MTRKHMAAAAAGVLTAVLVAMVAGGLIADDSEDAGASASTIAGVHVLYQVGGAAASPSQALSALNSQASAITTVLNWPGVTHFGLRAAWTAFENSDGSLNTGILDRARAITNATGDGLTVRFMAGRSTPSRILNACPTVTSGSTRAPAPYTSSGALNTCYLTQYDAFVSRLAMWARANNVHYIHLSHYGLDWAEFNVGPEIQTIMDGSMGMSSAEQTAMVNATNALVDVGKKYAGSDLSFELPMSGKGPVMLAGAQPGIAERVTQHVVAVFGRESDQFLIQGNGWDHSDNDTSTPQPNFNRVWGAPALSTENAMNEVLQWGALFGVQDINPLSRTQAQWTQMFDYAESKHAVTAEVYLGASTQGSSATALKAAIPGFVPYIPAGTPPTTTTSTTAATTTTTGATTTSSTSTTTVPETTTTTTAPLGECVATWSGTQVESKQTTQAACVLA